MLNESRIDVYDYLYNLFCGVVTNNVYSMSEPQELTRSDVEDGFLVIEVGNITDESEFSHEAYGWVRCYVTAYVPPITRGRLDYEKYKTYEDTINEVIHSASSSSDGAYYIQEGSVLSMDDIESNNANNTFFVFVKSFIVNIDG